MKEETLEPVKNLAYWKKNAEEDYLRVPISVLRYITELEERMYSEEEVESLLQRFRSYSYNHGCGNAEFEEWFNEFKKK